MISQLSANYKFRSINTAQILQYSFKDDSHTAHSTADHSFAVYSAKSPRAQARQLQPMMLSGWSYVFMNKVLWEQSIAIQLYSTYDCFHTA